MSKKCRAFSESKLGLEPTDNRKAFYAGWDAALRTALAESGRDWSLLEATQESLREHMAEIHRLRAALAQQAAPVQQAEPVQEPVAWYFEARHIDSAWGAAVSLKHPGPEGVYMRNVKPLYTAPPKAEPVQEPVAWNWMLDGQPYGQAYYGNPPDEDIAERAAIAGRTVRLLYTAPPQRTMVPLTEEEIFKIENDIPDDVISDRAWTICLTRAVEKAVWEKNHGQA